MLIIHGYKPIGSSDNGICDRCGTLCPRQTVVMAAVDQDGLVDDSVFCHWGVCCAAQYCYGAKTAKNRAKVLADIRKHEEQEQAYRDDRERMIAKGVTRVYLQTKHTGSGYMYREEQTLTFDSIRAHANHLFSLRGIPLYGTYLMSNSDGHEVRVNGMNAKEVAFYAKRGFVQCTSVNMVKL